MYKSNRVPRPAKARASSEHPPTSRPKLIIIAGPTASGKSDLALRLARKFNGEIISADSRQVYRGMDIGTGKVTRKEQRLVPHYLIDIANPKRQFTADDFKKSGRKAIADIVSRGKTPIIVGGTGFYIDTLIGRMSIVQVPPDKKLRAKFDKLSPEKLFKKLKKLDPKRAKNIDRYNKRRLVRALEIVLTTGKPVPSTKAPENEPEYDILWLGLNPKDLQKRIRIRLKKRFRQGMISEVKKLYRSGVSFRHLYDLGLEYRWIAEYLQNKISRKEMEAGLYKAIARYSKRQMTWFKRNKEIRWLGRPTQASRLTAKFIRL